MRRNSYCQRAMHSRGKSAIQWDNLQPLLLAAPPIEKFPKAYWYHNHNYSKELLWLSISKPHCNTILLRHLIDLISFEKHRQKSPVLLTVSHSKQQRILEGRKHRNDG